MQTNGAGSHAVVAESNPLHSALASFGYSDFHIQNHSMVGNPFPPAFGEEFWSSQGVGKYVGEISSASYPFESPKSVVHSTFEAANCSYEEIPYDGGARWDFNRDAPDHEPQESPMNTEWTWTDQGWSKAVPIDLGPSRFSKELSLSLSTSRPCEVVHGATSIREQGGSELSSSGATSSYSLHGRHIVGSDNTSCSSNNNNLPSGFNTRKTFPISGSRFFQAMQEILAEFACYTIDQNHDHRPPIRAVELESDHGYTPRSNHLSCGKELESKKRHLLSLLQVVDEQYSQCVDEIHTVITAFHAVTELNPNLHARFALPTVSTMYRNLREKISTHILSAGARQSPFETRDDNSSFETNFLQKQWALQQLKKRDHQLWRPQRGLPERSVSVLRAWMFENFLHPYPKDAEKHLLALKSGLTRSQVSNWFINARVRLWKPMIEEMYAEMNKRNASKNQEEGNGSHVVNHLFLESRRFAVD